MNSNQMSGESMEAGLAHAPKDWNKVFEALRAPFSSDQIEFRIGARTSDKTRGQALPYIDARAVQNRLDEAVGPANWKNELVAAPNGGGVMCTISLKIDGEWVGKSDVAQQDAVGNAGGGRADGQDPNQKFEIAVKGAVSDALKRAAVMWGIGRYLYDYEAEWVALKNEGKQFAETPKLPAHMLPPGDRGAKGGSSSSRFSSRQGSTSAGATGASGPSNRSAQNTGASGHQSTSGATGGGEKQPQSSGAAQERPTQQGSSSAQPSQAASAQQPAAAQGAAPDATPTSPQGQGLKISKEQWNSLPEDVRKHVRLLKQRIDQRLALASVEEYLKTGKGKDYPEWLKSGLFEEIKQARATPEKQPEQPAAA